MTNNKKIYFAVDKGSSSSHKTGWKPIQHIFSWTLVKAVDNWLGFSAFWHVPLLCVVSSLKFEVSS